LDCGNGRGSGGDGVYGATVSGGGCVSPRLKSLSVALQWVLKKAHVFLLLLFASTHGKPS
jgi:hypothetical protein